MPDDKSGPAFPVFPEAGVCSGTNGMSLRDWFAGQALIGLAAAVRGPGCSDWTYYSGAAYAIADAMLAERDKP